MGIIINAPPPGGSWSVRRLGEDRRAAVLRHLLSLNADDRYLRFGYAASDAAINAYVAGLDLTRDALLAVSAGATSRGFLIGIAHVALQAPAEFGLSVLPAWRCRGLGRRLFVAAMSCAAAHDMHLLVCVTSNASVLNMARSLGFAVCLGDGEPRASIRLTSLKLCLI